MTTGRRCEASAECHNRKLVLGFALLVVLNACSRSLSFNVILRAGDVFSTLAGRTLLRSRGLNELCDAIAKDHVRAGARKQRVEVWLP